MMHFKRKKNGAEPCVSYFIILFNEYFVHTVFIFRDYP